MTPQAGIAELKTENAAARAHVSELPRRRWQSWMGRQAISSAQGLATSRR